MAITIFTLMMQGYSNKHTSTYSKTTDSIKASGLHHYTSARPRKPEQAPEQWKGTYKHHTHHYSPTNPVASNMPQVHSMSQQPLQPTALQILQYFGPHSSNNITMQIQMCTPHPQLMTLQQPMTRKEDLK